MSDTGTREDEMTQEQWEDVICYVDPHFWRRYPDLCRETAKAIMLALKRVPR